VETITDNNDFCWDCLAPTVWTSVGTHVHTSDAVFSCFHREYGLENAGVPRFRGGTGPQVLLTTSATTATTPLLTTTTTTFSFVFNDMTATNI
jgi:hypothetical protein